METERKKPPLLRRIPSHTWICVAAIVIMQLLVFYGTHLLEAGRPAHILTSALDERIPLAPAWVTIYFLSFISWIVSVFWICSESRERGYRFTAGYLAALLISGVIFVAYPTTMQRPEIVGDGIFEKLMRFLYWVDTPQNLLPSLHVVLSYYCWRGTMGSKTIPAWFRRFNFIFLLLVCACVVLVKQHVLIDIPAGVVVAELSLLISGLLHSDRLLYATEDQIHHLRE